MRSFGKVFFCAALLAALTLPLAPKAQAATGNLGIKIEDGGSGKVFVVSVDSSNAKKAGIKTGWKLFKIYHPKSNRTYDIPSVQRALSVKKALPDNCQTYFYFKDGNNKTKKIKAEFPATPSGPVIFSLP